MMRSAWAVIAGFLFIFVLSTGSDAIARAMWHGAVMTGTPFLILSTLYVGVFAVVGSYLTARLAPARPMMHALVLGVLGFILNAVAVATMWGKVPAWYSVLNLVLVMPYAWFGGRLRESEVAGAVAPPAGAVPA